MQESVFPFLEKINTAETMIREWRVRIADS
jgi:hypothetical protein